MEPSLILIEPVVYPSSDGKPMADSTKQFNLITLLKENLEFHFADRPDVFVAGDLLWYPVEGNPKIATAPDVMVVFGRPKGDRKSYIQHLEDGIAPQVVIEIVSESNRRNPLEMVRKMSFYDRFSIEEYYIYDPDSAEFEVFMRSNGRFSEVTPLEFPFRSPLLQIAFDIIEGELFVTYPNGDLFKRIINLKSELNDTKSELNDTKSELNYAKSELDAERAKAEKLAATLRELGINPED